MNRQVVTVMEIVMAHIRTYRRQKSRHPAVKAFFIISAMAVAITMDLVFRVLR
jgi:hypothetical protein